ncbi:hypothetical protein KKB01_03275, partial [bacterium]|nr:hypothetical protein [bacterium]
MRVKGYIAVKTPKEDVNLEIKGKSLLVKSNNFEKNIELPSYFRNIKKKQYKNKENSKKKENQSFINENMLFDTF